MPIVLDASASSPTPATVGRSVRLSWPATALGAEFARFQIDRMDSLDSEWRRVAELTSVTRTSWQDWEMRLAVASTYRIRQVRTDGAPSEWTMSAQVTPTDPSGKWGFVTNSAPGLNKMLHVQEPRAYGMPDNQTIVEFYGRDGAASFRGTEDRLDEQTLEVWVDQGDGRPGRAVFDVVRDLARAQVPYVCVSDCDGNRWFATLTLGEGAENWRDGFYTIPITVRELTRIPHPAG